MARRRKITIDGRENNIEGNSDTTIREALEQAGIDKENLPPSIVSDGEVISASDYGRPAPPHEMLINVTDIEKGATLRDRLLDREFALITRLLREFPGRSRSLELTENFLLIRGFPLPDTYQTDHVDLLFVISGYFEVPPAGLHIPSKTVNRDQIAKHLNGHVMSGAPSHLLDHTPATYRKTIEQLAQQGWDWVCYHYKDWTWKLNPNNLLAGDCLYKLTEAAFAALSGKHK